MKTNKSGSVQQLNPTYEARPVWTQKQGLHVRLAPIAWWFWVDTRTTCANWCEGNEVSWN